MTQKKPLKILIAPLDWGLGHATRCIPVIQALLEMGHEVVLAAEGNVAALLKENLPSLTILPLRGYRIRYGKSKFSFALRMIGQIPQILRSISRENKWLKSIVPIHGIDLVISDNRYGLYWEGVPCVIMTHQLQIISGFGQIPDYLLRRLHYRLLEKFDTCWVVDEPLGEGLAGKMSHPKDLPDNARYIGLLSQFKADGSGSTNEVGNQILMLLSGPEPSRSILENKLIRQATRLQNHQFVVVAGTPTNSTNPPLPPHIQYFPFLSALLLKEYINNALLVISRSGYTTLMDLAMLRKKALLIPTPGQTEQEYLAGMLSGKQVCLSKNQGNLDLENDIALALEKSGFVSFDQSEGHQLLKDELNRLTTNLSK